MVLFMFWSTWRVVSCRMVSSIEHLLLGWLPLLGHHWWILVALTCICHQRIVHSSSWPLHGHSSHMHLHLHLMTSTSHQHTMANHWWWLSFMLRHTTPFFRGLMCSLYRMVHHWLVEEVCREARGGSVAHVTGVVQMISTIIIDDVWWWVCSLVSGNQ